MSFIYDSENFDIRYDIPAPPSNITAAKSTAGAVLGTPGNISHKEAVISPSMK